MTVTKRTLNLSARSVKHFCAQKHMSVISVSGVHFVTLVPRRRIGFAASVISLYAKTVRGTLYQI